MFARIFHLFILSLFSIALVAGLYLRSINFGSINKNGFIRQFAYKATIMHRDTLLYNSYYLAGATEDAVYLGNVVNTTEVMSATDNLDHYTLSSIEITDDSNIAWQALHLKIDAPKIAAVEQFTPRFFSGTLDDKKMTGEKIRISSVTGWLPIGNGSYILRTQDTVNDQYDLVKWTNQVLVPHGGPILQKQGDGTFSLDGSLLFDHASSTVVYVYYYRNEILVMDTNLAIKAQLKTIDTITQAKIEVATIASSRTKTIKKPPVIVNKRAAVYNNRLYIHSLRKADNQSQDDQAVIDCYDLSTKKYLFSFYLDIDPKKLSGMIVQGKRMYAIADEYLFAIDLID